MAKLFVANTSNVKEMKNGRPMNVEITKEQVAAAGEDGLANCTIVTLGAVGEGEKDHVYATTVLAADGVAAAVAAGTAFVIVAPEIMVEEARRTDGHIGKFRLGAGVYTAYQLQPHDRLELSADHPFVAAGTEIGERKMAEAIYLLEEEVAPVVMKKIEF